MATREYEVSLVRVSVVRESIATRVARPHNAAGAAEAFRAFVPEDEDREILGVILLDAKTCRGFQVVSIGTVDSTMVHPREVFRAAIVAGADGIIVIHNHPSGDPTPSPEDRSVAARLGAAGELLGIHLLDMVIVGEGERFYSLASER